VWAWFNPSTGNWGVDYDRNTFTAVSADDLSLPRTTPGTAVILDAETTDLDGHVVEVRHELEATGLADRVRVSSAGISGWHAGEPMDDRAAALLEAQGYPSAHSARHVDAEQLDADLLVVLDDERRRALQSRVPEPDRARLLR
jgi:hypothetical protein